MASAVTHGLSTLTGRVHPAVRARLRRIATPSRAADVGLLSVVVPMYNVAPYLERCLVSLVTQTYRNLEILLVDDGSTDGTAAVAAAYARRDRRIRLLTLPHTGNGRARNIGIKAATGRFLAFADADDVVPTEAYAVMVETLERTGSDFCVGSYGRIRGTKRTPVRLAERLHARESLGTTLDRCPEIIDDVFLWNKVFLRYFWNRSVGPMPEGIRYEDQETTARAYLRAGSFDILAPVVYWWRIREDGSSLTQTKYLVEDLRDRLTVAADVTALYAEEGDLRVQERWYRRLLGSDLIRYIEQVPDASEEYWKILHHGVRDLFAAGQEHLSRIDPQSRVLLFLADAGRREDIRRAVVDRTNNGTASPLAFDGERIFACPPLLSVLETGVPKDLLEVHPAELELVATLKKPVPDGALAGRRPGTATLHGHAYIRNVDLRATPLGLSVSTTAGTLLPVQRYHDPGMDQFSGDRNCSYADSAFCVRLALPLPEAVTIRAEVDGHIVERTLQIPASAEAAEGVKTTRTPVITRFTTLGDEAGGALVFDVEGAPAGAVFALVTARYRLPATAVSRSGRIQRLRVPLATERWGIRLPAPPSGSYTLRWRADGEGAGPSDPAVAVTPSAAEQFASTVLAAARIRGVRTETGAMAVSIGAPLADEETGTFHQYRLRRAAFGSVASAQPTPGIFFESFGGKSCSGIPRAISDYLADSGTDEPLYWSVTDRSVPVPAYSVPLLHGSAEWYERLSSTRILVNNNNFPWYFRKSAGQFYLQTWHGTPLKRIGRDIPQRLLSLSYRDLMAREAQWWDLLLAQNAFAAGMIPKALGYTGSVLEVGNPHIDALLGADAQARRQRTRTMLGMTPQHKAVLYAPTWRDRARDADGRSDWVGFLDIAEASSRLGPDYIFLLRGHHNVAGQRRMGHHPRAIDVTDYPEINDLFLASDALVTDYSSALFDYALLGRPIYLLVPDLEEYRRTRGLYLDPAKDLEGVPAVTTTEELVSSMLQAPDGITRIPAGLTQVTASDSGSSAAAVVAVLRTLSMGAGRFGAPTELTHLTGDHRG